MRVARAFRRELDLWATGWQQVETFLDRIDAARDADDPHARVAEALLRVADVVERGHARRDPPTALSPPVVEALPGHHWSPGSQAVVGTDSTFAWAPEQRRWRVPGTDELELAVAQLRTSVDDGDVTVHDQVRVPRERPIFTRSAQPGDPPALLRLPAYPGGTAGTIVGGGRTVDVAPLPDVDADTASLFGQAARFAAAMVGVPGQDEDEDEDPPEPVLAWSALCVRRRFAARDGEIPISARPGGPAPLATGVGPTARAVVAGLRAQTMTSSVATGLLLGVAAHARQALADAVPDAARLVDVATILDSEGCRTPDLPDRVRDAATALTGAETAWRGLAEAADALRLSLASASARQALESAADAVASAAGPLLLTMPVELGQVRIDLDAAIAARVGYPDGTLRMLRALEGAFTASWPGWLRWFRLRYQALLAPLATRFRAPFVTGVRALVNGGDTGLIYQGLTLGDNATAGVELVPTGQPSSLGRSLVELEPGTVGVIGGDRPAAVVVLGVDRIDRQLALNIAPLRTSTETDGPGAPGVVPVGSLLGTVAPGLSEAELRTGESTLGAAADGPLHEAIALWSRLCLVYGRALVDDEVAGGDGLRSITEPTSAPLQTVSLHGSVPARASSLVLAGLGPPFWSLLDGEPTPLIGRPGELLLVRGTAGSGSGELVVQGVVEIERVIRTSAALLDRIDTSAAGVLSTDPAALPGPEGGAAPDGAGPCLICGPQEDVAVVVLRRSWLTEPVSGPVTLRRDFPGFDLPSLATKRLLPLDLLADVLGSDAASTGPADVDRADEFTAALEIFTGWTQHALRD
ncbi:hypothetical protein [Cryptosporangium minutisporangium]|uniref:hypothetical protein n=1 Tax=Cryptosporangium minutisporangium TaxID=113569 RepID=UPI0035EE644E